ncbi:YdcH family protein [Roseomonas sp. KE2513]|uniref:YdcH family protein n=1 Tax=Roseomonas sp. KE2513 TaxID=2479202 RepID=UPI0018DF43EC
MAQQLGHGNVFERLAALDQYNAHLEVRLQDALSAPRPDAERVTRLKTEKLRVRDAIAALAHYLEHGPSQNVQNFRSAGARHASEASPMHAL